MSKLLRDTRNYIFRVRGEIWRKYTCSMEGGIERVIDRNRDNVACLIAATSVICLRYTRLNTSVEIVFHRQSNENSEPRIIIRQNLALLPLKFPLSFSFYEANFNRRKHPNACRIGIENIIFKEDTYSSFVMKRSSCLRDI